MLGDLISFTRWKYISTINANFIQCILHFIQSTGTQEITFVYFTMNKYSFESSLVR